MSATATQLLEETEEPETETAQGPQAVGVPTGAPLPGFAPGADRGSSPGGAPPPTPPPPTTTSIGDEDPGLDADWDGAHTPRRVGLGTARAFEPFLAELVETAGTAANERAQDNHGHPDQWLVDAQDRTISEPLARIVSRLLPARAGIIGEPNLRDAIEAALILARYAMKQLNLSVAWRRRRRLEAQA